jgi:inner membrane protein
MAAAILPDADLISRLFGIPHTHDFGHRGATHTILFALLLAAIAAFHAGKLLVRRRVAFLFIFFSALSHPLSDMLTNGGKGIMLFWPFDSTRFAWAVRPVEVSPILLRGFEDGRIWSVLMSEVQWLWGPAIVIAVIVRLIATARRSRYARSD